MDPDWVRATEVIGGGVLLLGMLLWLYHWLTLRQFNSEQKRHLRRAAYEELLRKK